MDREPTTAGLDVVRTNTILYCAQWADTVAFYRDTLGLEVTHETDWFIEVSLADTAHLSLADAARATVPPGRGAGITLSWEIADVAATHATLVGLGVDVTDVATRWSAHYVELHDPEGTRIELWAPAPESSRIVPDRIVN